MIAGGASFAPSLWSLPDIGCGLTEQICMLIYRFQDTGQYQQELYVLVRCLARIQQVDAIVRGQRPVVVLTGTIDTCERFLMQQTFQTVLCMLLSLRSA